MISDEFINEAIFLELAFNEGKIPFERLSDVRHYLDHDEVGMAFEYFVLEIIERNLEFKYMSIGQIYEVALHFNLHKSSECMVDSSFWSKFIGFYSERKDVGSQ